MITYAEVMEALKEGMPWTCPRCGRYGMDHPAMSRRDNATPVCSQCGTDEATLAWLGLYPWPTETRIEEP